LYGTIGLVFQIRGILLEQKDLVGMVNNNEITEVDIVGMPGF
jgi:hypothetical protein